MNVSEFSRLVGLTPHTIRYYDKIGLLSCVERLPNGHRFFSEKDIKWIEFVQRAKNTGMDLKKILEYSRLRKEGSGTFKQRQKILKNHSKELELQIDKMQRHLDYLHNKIEIYQSAIDGKISID